MRNTTLEAPTLRLHRPTPEHDRIVRHRFVIDTDLVGGKYDLRVDRESETNGLDLSTHGERAYDMNS